MHPGTDHVGPDGRLQLRHQEHARLPLEMELRPATMGGLCEVQREAILDLAAGSPAALTTLVEMPPVLTAPASPKLERIDLGYPCVDNSQQDDAVARICAMARGQLLLIQGPPGTGKTSSIVEAVVRLCSRSQTSVIFSSHSNHAVDSGQSRLRGISQSPDRLGQEGKVGNEVADLVSRDGGIGDFNVIAGTCSRLTVDTALDERPFDWLILDEVNKVRVSEALPLMELAHRWVLVGDPLQLPPVLDDASASFPGSDPVARLVRERSLYEWLWNQMPTAARCASSSSSGCGRAFAKPSHGSSTTISSCSSARPVVWVCPGLSNNDDRVLRGPYPRRGMSASYCLSVRPSDTLCAHNGL